MQPFSRKKRTILLIVLIICFFITVPILVIYSMGYRIGDTLIWTKTGGVYTVNNELGAEVYLDKKLVKTNNFFQRNILIQNIKPGKHLIIVAKDGFYSWGKEIEVLPERVTEVHATILPKEIPLVALSESNFSKSEKVEVEDLFKKKAGATTTKPIVRNYKNVSLQSVPDTLVVSWLGGNKTMPYYFCNITKCEESYVIPIQGLRDYDFYPGLEDLVVTKLNNGIYAMELDGRSNQNRFPLLNDENADFIVYKNEFVIIKTKDGIFQVDY